MKCLKRIQCKRTPEARPRKRPIPIITVPVFFLAALVMLCMTTIVSAQSLLQVRPTAQEEQLAACLSQFAGMNNVSKNSCEKGLAQYMRDGCIAALAGDWRWDSLGDIVRITYDEKHGTFGGNVIRPVKLNYNSGHLLFIVSFPKDSMKKMAGDAWQDRLDNRYQFPVDGYVAFLRGKKNCKRWWFEGTEYSFDQNTKQRTEMKLNLVLQDEKLEYKIGGKAWSLYRMR